MLTHYCSNCWANVGEKETTCPNCGFDLSEFSQYPYEKKLLLALKPPVPERRIIAIKALGELNNIECLGSFQQMLLNDTEDYYTLAAVIEALPKIDHPRSESLLLKAANHPSKMVRERGAEALREKASIPKE